MSNSLVPTKKSELLRHRGTEKDRDRSISPMHENEIGTIVVNEAIHLYQGLGPGLLESVYEIVRGKPSP